MLNINITDNSLSIKLYDSIKFNNSLGLFYQDGEYLTEDNQIIFDDDLETLFKSLLSDNFNIQVIDKCIIILRHNLQFYYNSNYTSIKQLIFLLNDNKELIFNIIDFFLYSNFNSIWKR